MKQTKAYFLIVYSWSKQTNNWSLYKVTDRYFLSHEEAVRARNRLSLENCGYQYKVKIAETQYYIVA